MGLIRWGITGLLALVIALVATAWFLPASLAFRLLEPNLAFPSEFLIALPRGTVRQGHTDVTFRGFPQSRVSWKAGWPIFIGDSFAFTQSFRFDGPGHNLLGNLAIRLNQEGLSITQLNGQIQSSDINELAADYGHHFSGIITIKDGFIDLSAQCLNALEGDLSWTGGSISLNGFNGVFTYQLPSLQASLARQDCAAALDLTRNGQSLARLTLGFDGWFSAEIQRSLMILAQVPGAEQLSGTLLFEEKIL